jgi:hypothetical protein
MLFVYFIDGYLNFSETGPACHKWTARQINQKELQPIPMQNKEKIPKLEGYHDPQTANEAGPPSVKLLDHTMSPCPCYRLSDNLRRSQA